MTLHRLLVALPLVLLAAGCAPGSIDDEDGDIESALVAGDPHKIDIGFDGLVDQFGYFADFYDKNVAADAHLCHGYIGWNVANQPPQHGDVTDPDARSYVDHWLATAEGHCDEALISFKTGTHGSPPTEAQFAAAFHNFVTADWASEAGFTGRFAFTPWNEPNNAADAGDGLGVIIDARLAARYYLAAEKECRAAGCKVAAGDFASNGNMWNDFEWNCANDNVAAAQLCKTKSSANKSGAPSSYLDRYKNEIANEATHFGLPAGFRAEYFAYHGWHDTNEYINDASHCSTYGDCALRRILQSLGGSWGGVALWDSEDGLGQNVPIADGEQACGAAFLLRLLSISRRVDRLYITRLHGGGGQLLDGHTPRPAMDVLADRDRTYAAGHCD
jgi:hypothetical protein